MTKHNAVLTTYYTTGVLLLAFQIVNTVFQGSLVVNYGQKLAHLETEKTALHQKQQLLRHQLATSVSLVSLSQSDVYNQFQPIAQTLKITDTQAVASR